MAGSSASVSVDGSSFQDAVTQLFPSLPLKELPFTLPTAKLDRLAITIPEGASSLLETSEVITEMLLHRPTLPIAKLLVCI